MSCVYMETFLYKSDDELKFMFGTTKDWIDKLFQIKTQNVKYHLLGPSQANSSLREEPVMNNLKLEKIFFFIIYL